MDKVKNGDISHRNFKPTYWALSNKNTIYILTFFLLIGGIFTYRSMQRELFPEIVIPYIMIQTPYPGNSPPDIENLITRPIEKQLKGLNGVKVLSSASYQDMSLIMVEFEADVDVRQALQDVKDEVDKAKSDLPDDMDFDPIVEDIDFSEFPILNINLSGDYSLYELKQFAENLQEDIESLREIREADIRGVDERQINILVNPLLLEAYDLSFMDLELAIMTENVNIGAGEILVDGTRRSLRTEANYRSMEELESTIVKFENDKIVYLRDVARVIDGFEDQSTIARLNNQPVVSLSVIKKSGENLLDATDQIFRIIENKQASGQLPPDLSITVTDDMSVYIRDQISNLENSILLGMILVILVLYLFMGIRNAFFSGIAIPMSMFISFLVLGELGYTINTMILFSLLLALGMLVDNAIVVVENSYRLYEEGYGKLDAIKKGVSEIAVPIITSTATTLAAFFPLLLWPGIVGEFMKFLPITLIIVLTSSLFVALVLNPVFMARFVKVEDPTAKVNIKRLFLITGILAAIGIVFYIADNILMGNLLVLPLLMSLLNVYVLKPGARNFQQRFLPWIDRQYEKTLRLAMGRLTSKMLVAAMFVLFVVSIMIFGASNPNVIFFPENEPKTVYITMELPLGTDIDRTDVVSREAEKIVFEVLEAYEHIVKSVGVNVGNGKGDFFEPSRAPNKALFTITFVEFIDRDGISTSKIMLELTEALKNFTGAEFFVEKEDEGPPVGRPINIEVSGDDFATLVSLAEDIKHTIDDRRIPGIENLQLDINMSKPEMLLTIDREMVRRLGLSTELVASTMRTALYGNRVDKFKDGEDEFDIVVRLDDEFRNNVSALMNMKIKVEKEGFSYHIPVSSVADYSYGTTYEDIKRKDNTRVITVYSNVIEGYNANKINNDIRELLGRYEMPPGYYWEMTGEQENQQETSDFLLRALFIAIALISMILITQFNSAIKPMIILATVVLSTIGVFLGLAAFNMDFVILMTGVGIVSLAGIVVNNGIVLIDYIDIKRNERREVLGLHSRARLTREDEVEAVISAGRTRLRPVLLTAITTILGLIPLAIGLNFDFFSLFTQLDPKIYFGGDNAAFWGPMSSAVIFGLTTSTFLTLIMAPVMYNMAVRVRNYYVKEKVADED
ncbi:efflux RND transporter permease subunit [Alkalitalea saponilacus]|uniref:Multidrug efflux pump subunit AcrB n=1 Tax=Alkalitalea saponilacus TaxID=889453 RepID=A0A1T5EGV6_9BACT|nr:efflux RND transporter permease subunit [Alkalitalea saponilacus]ASB48992.1 copper transporter [Alkalitalea saponilacus]SKB83015.1 Multidrug efflux pump subunit AcrB [Alkalitalea saponilacus]